MPNLCSPPITDMLRSSCKTETKAQRGTCMKYSPSLYGKKEISCKPQATSLPPSGLLP